VQQQSEIKQSETEAFNPINEVAKSETLNTAHGQPRKSEILQNTLKRSDSFRLNI
jgi:hypothetical protein